MDSCCIFPCTAEELKNGGLAFSDGGFCKGNAKTTASATSPKSHVRVQDESAAFVGILRSCTKNRDLYQGIRIHDDILKRGLVEECSDALVTMYAKCGELGKAKALLDTHKSRDAITWTALIVGYVQQGHGQKALDCYECMRVEGIPPDGVTYAGVLRACGITGAIDEAEKIHDEVIRKGLLHNDMMLGTAIVDMYAKCGALSKAQDALENLPSRTVASWSALIAGYARQGKGDEALTCFESMRSEGIVPDAVTYACILKACATLGVIDKGEKIHDEISRQGLLQNNVVLGTALVDMYAKCNALVKAKCVLEELPSRNVVTWNVLVAGHVQQGQGLQALECFEQMQRDGIVPDAVSYTCILRACASLRALEKGEQIHEEIVKKGLLQKDGMLGAALIAMYAKCRAISKAWHVFQELSVQNIVTWNALISGYVQEGQGEQALNCYELMQHDGILPDARTYTCILKACAALEILDIGEQIHEAIAGQGLLQDDILLGTALVDMYAKCGATAKAHHVLLEELPFRDVVAWNALIAGHVQEGQGEQALDCLDHMRVEGIAPSVITYACILKACGIIGATHKGTAIHDEIVRQELLHNNLVLGNALVDMYAKCGVVSKAKHVLDELPYRDAVSWNALIAGYTHEGQGQQLWNSFECMQYDGILPDTVTFVCVLNMCSHLGLVEQGHAIFAEMANKYSVRPNLECYICLVDLFGRAGQVEKAVRLIQEVPSSNHCAIWTALLGGCQKWGFVNVGKWAFERAVHVDKVGGPAYVAMANMYAAAEMQLVP